MSRFLRAAAVIVGVVGGCVVAVAMLAGPLSDDPGPTTFERFVMFAYPICLVLGGIFVSLRLRIGLVYGLLGVMFGVTFAVIMVGRTTNGWDGLVNQVVFTIIVVGPALILSSLCWSAMRQETRTA